MPKTSSPRPFKIASSQIKGWHRNILDLQENNPSLLEPNSDYKGAGKVIVAFGATGVALAIRYLDTLRITESFSAHDFAISTELENMEGYAFLESMLATEFKTLMIENIFSMVDHGNAPKSAIGLTGSVTLEDGNFSHFSSGLPVPPKRFSVHVFREIRLRFDDVLAGSADETAMIARDKALQNLVPEETDITEGQVTGALVDLVGDETYRHTQHFDFVIPTDRSKDLPDYHHLANDLFEALVRLKSESEPHFPKTTNGVPGNDFPWLRVLIMKARYRLARD